MEQHCSRRLTELLGYHWLWSLKNAKFPCKFVLIISENIHIENRKEVREHVDQWLFLIGLWVILILFHILGSFHTLFNM